MKKKSLIVVIIIILVLVIGLEICTKIWNDYTYDERYRDKINDLLADDVEIEKKWLINPDDIPYDLSNADISKIEQTYISFSPEIRVRRLNDGEYYTFTLKKNLTEDGIQRDEVDFQITEEEYENLLEKQEGNTIYKTRYQMLVDNQIIAIDLFDGELKGLAYLEIEFQNIEEAKNFPEPDWIIKDVTDDVNYKNGYLARYGIPE